MTHSDALPSNARDVIVVGAGPSGLTTAMEIAASGVSVTVLEKRGEPALSRAGVVQPRVMEIFAMRGLDDVVIRRAREVNGDGWQNDKGIWAGLPGIDYGLLDTDFPFIVYLSQIEVEGILLRRCLELGVEVRRNAEVTSVDQDADSVTVLFRENSEERALRAQYVVGADGARSAVRQSLGLSWEGHEARNLAVNVDAELPFPFPHTGQTVVINTRAGWGLCYPLSEQVTRFAVIDAETMIGVGRDTRIDADSAFESLRRIFGSDYGVPPARISQFHDAMFRAGALRKGRVLLVGESVRVHYPAAGVGMNFCIQDATNLGWKVAAAVQGWGPEDILDTYESERGPEVDDHLDNVRAQTGIQFSFTDESVALKDMLLRRIYPVKGVQKALAAQLSGLSAHYGDPDELVGAHALDGALADGTRLFDAISASAYTVVGPDAESTIAAAPPHLRVASGVVNGADGSYTIVRPDGYIDFVGDAAAVIDRLGELRLS